MDMTQFLMCSGFDYEGKVEAVKILLDRRIDAMILVGSHYAGDCGQNDIQYLKDAAQKSSCGTYEWLRSCTGSILCFNR